ncbi:hypothetical protein QU38_02215, partial [Staphylococcus aureus]
AAPRGEDRHVQARRAQGHGGAGADVRAERAVRFRPREISRRDADGGGLNPGSLHPRAPFAVSRSSASHCHWPG